MSIKTATLNGVATIEIARPEKKNAITGAMYHAMADALDAARDDPAVRAVLITGQPGIFTSGNDIEDFMQRPAGIEESPAFAFMKALIGCDKPVVAAVTGAAIGIGTTMLLHCDFVYVSDEARLAMPFVSLGPRARVRVEPDRAAADGQRARRREAAARRPVHRRRRGRVRHRQRGAAGERGRQPCAPHRRALQCAAAGRRARDQAADARARRAAACSRRSRVEGAVFGARLQSPEAKEAFSAFFQKRKPDFSQF